LRHRLPGLWGWFGCIIYGDLDKDSTDGDGRDDSSALEQAFSQPPPPEAAPNPATSHPHHAHGPHATAIVRAMLEHVRDHYQRPLDLSDLAEVLGRNPSYLSSLFAAHMGVHFHHYLCEFRLARAMELLRDPFRRISDIAAATGHVSASHFNNLFKSMTGLSPSAWRDANTPSQ
jgi:transcriptional regulator GlxA family with amidase domain